MFFFLGATLGLSLLIFGLRLGALGIYSCVFLRLSGRTLDLFFDFSGNGSPECKQKRDKIEMDAFSMEFQVFPENAKCVSTAPVRAD